MPIYEYECQDCRHQFDILQKMNEEPLSVCPDCQHHSLVRLVSAAGFQLKGTGWYVTDFKNNDKKPQASKKDSGESKVSSEAGSSESKSEAKSEKQATPSVEKDKQKS